jgi:hypothetical protein
MLEEARKMTKSHREIFFITTPCPPSQKNRIFLSFGDSNLSGLGLGLENAGFL